MRPPRPANSAFPRCLILSEPRANRKTVLLTVFAGSG
jgi:hypothetical protein